MTSFDKGNAYTKCNSNKKWQFKNCEIDSEEVDNYSISTFAFLNKVNGSKNHENTSFLFCLILSIIEKTVQSIFQNRNFTKILKIWLRTCKSQNIRFYGTLNIERTILSTLICGCT